MHTYLVIYKNKNFIVPASHIIHLYSKLKKEYNIYQPSFIGFIK